HRQLVNYVAAVAERMELEEGEKLALVSTLAADLGNTVLYPSLCLGGTLHVMSSEVAGDGRELGEYFEREQVDCVKITPSHLKGLVAGGGKKVLPRKRLVLGGEGWTWEWVKELSPECEVMNHYGPTECTVGAIAGKVAKFELEKAGEKARERAGEKEKTEEESKSRRQGNVPLGRPLGKVQVYVLD